MSSSNRTIRSIDSSGNFIADIGRIIQEIPRTHDIGGFTALAGNLRELYSTFPSNSASVEGAEVERKLACATMMWLYVFVRRFESAVLSGFCSSEPRIGSFVPSVPQAYQECLDLAVEAVQHEGPAELDCQRPVRKAVKLLLGFVPTTEFLRSEPCSYCSDTQEFFKHVEEIVPSLISGSTIPNGNAFSPNMLDASNTPTFPAFIQDQDTSCRGTEQNSDAVIHAPTPRRHSDYLLTTESLSPSLDRSGKRPEAADNTGFVSETTATPRVEQGASSSSIPDRIGNSPRIETVEAPKGKKRKPRAPKKTAAGKRKRTRSERSPNKENIRDGHVA